MTRLIDGAGGFFSMSTVSLKTTRRPARPTGLALQIVVGTAGGALPLRGFRKTALTIGWNISDETVALTTA